MFTIKHYGDIKQLHGYDLEPVDVIIGGSPCQDISVAGPRTGIDGDRSSLFFEQIRIVKEMRENDIRNGKSERDARPKFMVWENVPAILSHNKGRDFQKVLTEIIKIIEPEAPDVPLPKGEKWAKAGCLYDEMGRFSLAWRVHDAQYWGVPQRRVRIGLIIDFGGLCAPEILYESEGMQRDLGSEREKKQATAPNTETGIN